MDDIAVLICLILPIIFWGYTVILLSKAGHTFWLRHLAGFFISAWSFVSALILVGSAGLFDDKPVPGLAVIGLLFLLPLAYVLWKIARLPKKILPAASISHVEPPSELDLTLDPSVLLDKPSPSDSPLKSVEQLANDQQQAAKHTHKHEQHNKPINQSTRGFSIQPLDGTNSVVVHFDYENGEGISSSRTVSVYEVSDAHFTGICHGQSEERTFRFDRIVGLATLHEGQKLIAPHELRNLLRGCDEQELRKQRRAEQKHTLEILFTGFQKDLRADLEEIAKLSGMTVRKTVTENLDFLCGGPRAGSSKQKQAIEIGATYINGDQFRALIETGELPGR